MVAANRLKVALCDLAMIKLSGHKLTEPAVLDKRRTGILLPITALPSKDFASALSVYLIFYPKQASVVWQLLPLGPTHIGRFSLPMFICLLPVTPEVHYVLDWLCDQGYLPKSILKDTVTVERKSHYLKQAFRYLKNNRVRHNDYLRFIVKQADWLDDYALFMALRQTQPNRPWINWHQDLRDRQPDRIQSAKQELKDPIEQIQFEQFIFAQQWQQIKDHAQQQGILLFGDIPLFIAHDSADVWSKRELFILNQQGEAEIVTGVPPDYFSAQGQRWDNPHYHWEFLDKTQFRWWKQRVGIELARFDLLRIDHFRGLVARLGDIKQRGHQPSMVIGCLFQVRSF